MKKMLITMAVVTGMVAGAMVFSSFMAPKHEKKTECVQTKSNVPVYWEGCAHACGEPYLFIKVYQTEGQCNSFYAIVTSAYYTSNNGKELWVRENPKYNPDKDRPYCYEKKYYVTCGGDDYYFNM